MAKHKDDEAVTWGDFRKLLRVVKKLEERLGDAFVGIATGDDAQAEFWNEHEEKLERLRRRMNRHEKEHDQLD